MKLLEVDGGRGKHVPQCPIVGDATGPGSRGMEQSSTHGRVQCGHLDSKTVRYCGRVVVF